jgi:hypothetical protein
MTISPSGLKRCVMPLKVGDRVHYKDNRDTDGVVTGLRKTVWTRELRYTVRWSTGRIISEYVGYAGGDLTLQDDFAEWIRKVKEADDATRQSNAVEGNSTQAVK